MARLEATPTEYRGIRFRSKCKAMFALWIDLESEEWSSIDVDARLYGCKCPFIVNSGKSPWIYEPSFKAIEYLKPDFWKGTILDVGGFPYLRHEFIEYKPSRPTKTYCERFFKNYYMATDYHPNLLKTSQASIYFGSVFSSERGLIFSDGPRGCYHEEEGDDWLVNYEDSIREYRFDLAVQK